MTQHHPHDGCHGEERSLSTEDHEAVSDAMGQMMLHVARKDFPAVMRAGAHIGMHYGPGGEWALALRLATQVVGLAPLEHCDDEGVPVLANALSPQDERVRLMTVHCLVMFPDINSTHTLTEVDEAIALSVPLVTEFVSHYKHDRKADCYAAWERMYSVTDVDTPPTRELAFRAATCSALLTCWASHYSAIRIGA